MARTSKSTPVQFKLYAPQAKRVALSGSFNNWDIRSLAAKKDSRGNWVAKVSLKPGRYEYKFLVDGSWVNDPHCSGGCIPNGFGTHNCVLEVK